MDNNYLVHHGIAGQKWGHQNGPPYPLSVSDYSAAEKRLAKSTKIKEKSESKAKKLYEKSAKYKIKAGKYEQKSNKQMQKAGKGLYTAVSEGHVDKSLKYQAKAARLIQKAGKTELKAIKLDQKANNYAKEILAAEKDIKLSDLATTKFERLVQDYTNSHKKELFENEDTPSAMRDMLVDINNSMGYKQGESPFTIDDLLYQVYGI